jgi:Fe-S-cluster containining protein
METVHIRLTIEGVEIEGAVDLPRAPSPRRVVLPTLQRLADAVVEIAERSAAEQGLAVSCHKGCDACCRQMVPIAPAEAYALAALLDELPPHESARLQRRFHETIDALDRSGLLPRLRDRHALSPAQLQQLDREYFLAGIPCPFLLDHACSIHSARPLACREFLVSSDPAHCAAPAAENVRQLPLGAKLSVALAHHDQHPWLPLALAREFAAGVIEEPSPHAPAELLRTVLHAL